MGLIGGVLAPVYCGIPNIIMAPATFLQNPFLWLDTISRSGATISGGPNFAYDLCVRKITAEQRATLDLSSWSVAFIGAEAVRSGHARPLRRGLRAVRIPAARPSIRAMAWRRRR